MVQLIPRANPVSGPRKQQRANAFSESKVISKRQSRSENPLRRLWTITESVLARIEILEHLDQDYSHDDPPRCVSPTSSSNLAKDEADRSLYKILEAALTRVSVLENRRDISYRSAFKASSGTECIIRGCGGDLSKREHALRHIKTTPTPEHQVAAIVLQQTGCLECNKSWKTPSGLVHHEATVHGDAYTSRMDFFRPVFEQTSCIRLSRISATIFANRLQTL